MSSEIDALVVRIAGDARDLQKALNGAKKDVDSFGKQVSGSMKKASQSFKAVGMSFTKYVTAPIAAFAGVGLHAFSKFNDNMTKSVSIMRDEFGNAISTEMVGKMEEAAIAIGNTTVTSSQKAAESYFFLASAGLSAAESVEALAIVNDAAIAGNFDMATATDLITDAQSALGLMVGTTAQKMANMTEVSDTLVKANTLANASVEQFATSLTSKAGAALKNFKKPMAEGVAVLAAMADQGIKGELAGESLNRMLLLLSKSAQSNAAAHDKLGFKVFDSTGKMRNMADIIGNLEKVTAGMSDQMLTSTLTQLGFDARVQGVILPLLGASDAISTYEEKLKDASGFTKAVASKNQESFSAQMKKTWNQIRNVAMEIGARLVPMIQTMTGWIKGAIDWWNGLSEGLKTTIFWVGGFLAAIGPVLLAIGSLLGMISAAIAGYIAWNAILSSGIIIQMASAAAQWVLNAAMAAMPYAIFIIAVAAIVKLSVAIYNANQDVKDLNRELERADKLHGLILEGHKKRAAAQDKLFSGEKNPTKRLKELEIAAKSANVELKGTEAGFNRAKKEEKRMAPTLLLRGAAGYQAQVKEVEQLEGLLAFRKEREQEILEQIKLTKIEMAEMAVLAEQTGIDDTQVLLVKEQATALNEMNAELKISVATWGMSKDEIEMYKASQSGATQATLDGLQAVADENEKMRESIKSKEEAKKKMDEMFNSIKANIKANKEYIESLKTEQETIGMTADQIAIFEMEQRGATKAQIDEARQLQKTNKAMKDREKHMKDGQKMMKDLRTPQQKLAEGEADLQKKLELGAIDLETYNKAMEKIHKDAAKDIKVNFKVSGIDAVAGGTAEAAARLAEFQALRPGNVPVNFRKQGQNILNNRGRNAAVGGAGGAVNKVPPQGSAVPNKLSSMDGYLELIAAATETIAEQNLVVIEPAGLA